MQYDPINMCCIDENGGQSRKFNYEVKFHLTNGLTVSMTAEDQQYDKINFADHLSLSNFVIIGDGSTSVNMKHVIYFEVKEITNDVN